MRIFITVLFTIAKLETTEMSSNREMDTIFLIYLYNEIKTTKYWSMQKHGWSSKTLQWAKEARLRVCLPLQYTSIASKPNLYQKVYQWRPRTEKGMVWNWLERSRREPGGVMETFMLHKCLNLWNSSLCTHKMGTFYWCKLYLNKFYFVKEKS